VRRLALHPCGEEERRKCEAEFPDPRHLAWACRHCDAIRPEEVSPYTAWLLRDLYPLWRARFPFAPDDLPLEVWRDLGQVADLLDRLREDARWRALLRLFGSSSRSAPRE